MLNVLPNVIALGAPYGAGPVTGIGYYLYLLYYGGFVIRVIISRSRGKPLHVVSEFVGLAAVFAVVLVLFFVDSSAKHKTITDAIIYGFIWLGSLFIIRVMLARLQKGVVPK